MSHLMLWTVQFVLAAFSVDCLVYGIVIHKI